MQVRAGPPSGLLAAAAQQFGDEVVALGEVGVAGLALVGVSRAARVFAIVAALRRRLLSARGVDLPRVVAPALVWVGEDVVGGRDLLEPLLGALVARIEIGMQLLGEPTVGLADLLGRRGFRDAEHLIGVSHA